MYQKTHVMRRYKARRKVARRRLGVRRRSRYSRVSRRRSGKARASATVTTVKGANQFFKDRVRTKLYFDCVVSFAPSGTGSTKYFAFSFRANSLYDPNATVSGSGDQPYGFDQFAALYRNYKVLGSKIKATPLSFDATTNTGLASAFQIVCLPNSTNTDYITSGVDYNDLPNMRLAKSRWISINSLNPARDYVSNYCSTAKFYGESKLNARIDDNNEALCTANPNAMWYWQCYGYNPTATASGSLVVNFRITYYAEFSGLKSQSSS